MLRFLFKSAMMLILVGAFVAVGAYLVGYWHGERRTQAATPMPGIDPGELRDKAADIADKAYDAGTRMAGTVEDGALTAKIKSKMALDDFVSARNIDVDTADGVVTVSGTVHSEAEHERAVRLARETEGVNKVVDRLVVRPAS